MVESGTRKKRARSAYILFSMDRRAVIVKNHPNEGIGGISKIIGKEWEKTSDAEKEKYQRKSDKEKAALLENPVYVKSKVKKGKGGTASKNNGIKRAKNAFMFFGDEHRPALMKKHPDWRIADIGRELGRLWRELPDSKKEKYQALNQKDKVRYERQMKAL